MGQPTPKDKEKPQGKEATIAALLDAADELFGEMGPNSVTVRDISARANVNHALLHRHFGSKEQLLSAIIERHRLAFKEQSKSVDNSEEALAHLFRNMLERPAFPRIFAHLVLDKRPVEEFVSQEGGTADLAAIIARSGIAEPEARKLAATISAFCLGWSLFREVTSYAADCSAAPDALDDFAQSALLTLLKAMSETLADTQPAET